jgi:hypothetical protein
VRDPQATEVQVTMRYGVGAADDPIGKAGMAHLVEHLMHQQVPGTQSLFAQLESGGSGRRCCAGGGSSSNSTNHHSGRTASRW